MNEKKVSLKMYFFPQLCLLVGLFYSMSTLVRLLFYLQVIVWFQISIPI